MIEVTPSALPAAFAATSFLSAAGLYVRARCRESAQKQNLVRERLRRLEAESMDLARGADEQRQALEDHERRIAALEAQVEAQAVALRAVAVAATHHDADELKPLRRREATPPATADALHHTGPVVVSPAAASVRAAMTGTTPRHPRRRLELLRPTDDDLLAPLAPQY